MKNKYLLLIGIVAASIISLTASVSAQPSSGDTPYTCYNNSLEVVACPSTSEFSDYEIGKCYRAIPSNQGETAVIEITCPNSPSGGGAGEGGGDPLSQATCTEEVLDSENCGIVGLAVIGINFLSAVAGVAIVASLMIAGFTYMTAQDDSGKIQKSRARIVQTLIALVLFIFMYSLLNFLVPGGVLPG